MASPNTTEPDCPGAMPSHCLKSRAASPTVALARYCRLQRVHEPNTSPALQRWPESARLVSSHALRAARVYSDGNRRGCERSDATGRDNERAKGDRGPDRMPNRSTPPIRIRMGHA